MSFDKPDFWNDMVMKASTVEAFKGITKAMFADNKTSSARLLVLETFARDVAKAHPGIGREVMRHYLHVFENSTNQYKIPQWHEEIFEVVLDVIQGLFSMLF